MYHHSRVLKNNFLPSASFLGGGGQHQQACHHDEQRLLQL